LVTKPVRGSYDRSRLAAIAQVNKRRQHDQNILIPLDGSEHSKAALDYAIWLARGLTAC